MRTGRPAKPENQRRVNTNVRLRPDLHRGLTDAADDRDVSVNFMITRAIEDYLDRLLPVEEVQWTRD